MFAFSGAEGWCSTPSRCEAPTSQGALRPDLEYRALSTVLIMGYIIVLRRLEWQQRTRSTDMSVEDLADADSSAGTISIHVKA